MSVFITLPVPREFDFLRTVLSHGWFDLPPFRWDPKTSSLTRGLALDGDRTAQITMSPSREGSGARKATITVGLTCRGRPRRSDRQEVVRQARWMLRLDEPLDVFYDLAGKMHRPNLKWVRSRGAGRLLRSCSVFEDLVKMICTTNCSWAFTRAMVGKLVQGLGQVGPAGVRAFPTPSAMASASARFYRDEVRAGYRAGALRELARKVVRGDLDPELWATTRLSVQKVREAILSVRGAGPYVVDNMLRLLGHYEGLGIDSWCRRKFSQLHPVRGAVSDQRIRDFYEPFGRWRGLALWCDLTRDWFEEDGRPEKLTTSPLDHI